MATREIQRNEWPAFLDTFSKEHQGLIATITVISPDIGAQEAVQGIPLAGITTDRKGSEKDSITILLGAEPVDRAEHFVTEATHLWVNAGGESAGDVIEIGARDGSQTILQLHASAELPA